jgi:hypothetical protein
VTVADLPTKKKKKRRDDDDLVAFWAAHNPDYLSGLISNDGWSFNPEAQIYISDRGSRFRQDDMRRAAFSFCKSAEQKMRENATALIALSDDEDDDGNPIIPPDAADQWRKDTEDDLDLVYTCLAAMAVGGEGNLEDEDRAAITGQVTTDTEPGYGTSDASDRLADFVEEMKQGSLSPKEILWRAGLYPQTGYITYTKAVGNSHARAVNDAGQRLYLWERNVLSPLVEKHCTETPYLLSCPQVSDAGWQLIGALPSPGLRACAEGCQCSFEYSLLGPLGDGEFAIGE